MPSRPSGRSRAASWLVGLICLGLVAGCGRKHDRIVLVTIDTLRADHLPMYGYARNTSPFLGELAERGVVFTRAHSTMSHTAPSHASIFTGQLPAVHGVLQNWEQLSNELPHLARVMRRGGYQTGAFTSATFLQRVATGFRTIDCELRQGEETVDRAITWVERLEPDQPFLLWVHLFDVHEAEITGSDIDTAYYDEVRRGASVPPESWYGYLAELHDLPDPPPGEPFPTIEWEPIQGEGNGRPRFRSSREEIVASVDHYDAQIAYADAQIERLYRAVEAVGSRKPCLWIVTADHGEGLGNHGYRGHSEHIYQEQLHVPLIVHSSDDGLEPRRDDSLVSLVDVFPTVLEATGERPGDDSPMEGVSLWPIVRDGESARPGRAVFAQRKPMPMTGDGVFAVLTGHRKYILHTGRDDEFFELARDPRELASDPDAVAAAELRDLATAKLDETGWEALLSPSGEEIPEELLEELRTLGYVE